MQRIDESLTVGGRLTAAQGINATSDSRIAGSLRVEGWLEAPNIKYPCRGLFVNREALTRAWPRPMDGEYAFVGPSLPASIYRAQERRWVDTGTLGGEVHFDVENSEVQPCSCEDALTGINASLAEHMAEIGRLQSDLDRLRITDSSNNDVLEGKYLKLDAAVNEQRMELEQILTDLGKVETTAGDAMITATEAYNIAASASSAAPFQRFHGFNNEDAGYSGTGISTQTATLVKYHTLYCHFEAQVVEAGRIRMVRRWHGAEKFNDYDAEGIPTARKDMLFLYAGRLYVATNSELTALQ